MTQGEVYYYLKLRLQNNGWELLGGEPPDGSNALRRIEIRSKQVDRKGSTGSYKIDLIAKKASYLALIEIYPTYSQKDVDKLNLITGKRIEDLFGALKERCNIEKNEIKTILKCLALVDLDKPVPDDFVIFQFKEPEVVELLIGNSMERHLIDEIKL